AVVLFMTRFVVTLAIFVGRFVTAFEFRFPGGALPLFARRAVFMRAPAAQAEGRQFRLRRRGGLGGFTVFGGRLFYLRFFSLGFFRFGFFNRRGRFRRFLFRFVRRVVDLGMTHRGQDVIQLRDRAAQPFGHFMLGLE